MSLKNQQDFVNEDFVGRTTRDLTAGPGNNELFANPDIVNQSQNNTNITQLASGLGNTFTLADVVPKINLDEGFNIFGYTLPYPFDATMMLFSIFIPEAFNIPELANHLLDNGGIENNIIPLTEIIVNSSDENTPETLANFLLLNYPDVYQKIKDKTVFNIMDENIIIAKNNDGDSLLPNYNFNGIGDFIPGEGYQIKMRNIYNNAQFFAIKANNQNINSENDYLNIQNENEFTLNVGWNLISYNRLGNDPNQSQDMADIFNILGRSDFSPQLNHIESALPGSIAVFPTGIVQGVGTNFLSDFSPGEFITFDIQSQKIQRLILSIESDNVLYLAGTYTGLTGPSDFHYKSQYRGINIPSGSFTSSITNSITLVKNNDGDIFYPEYGFNGIGNFVPGEGYQIKMLEEKTIVFPSDILKTDTSLIEDIELGFTTIEDTKNTLQH